MLLRERPAASIALPAPAPLPSLSAAFSRRAAIFGATVTAGALAGSAGRALAPAGGDADYTAAQERFEAAFYAYQALRVRLVELRTDDPEVLTLKALAIVDLCNRDPARLDRLIAHAAEKEDEPRETALVLSIVRDFIGLFGRSAWVSA